MSYFDIVFDGPPSQPAPRFVEVENEQGASVKVGEWVERDDGYWVLRLEGYVRLDGVDVEALREALTEYRPVVAEGDTTE